MEHFSLPSLRADAPMKRMRVQARQVYVFSHAAELGWPGGGLEHAARGLAWMERGWTEERGWARTLSPSGEPSDTTTDLYDQAFALFALGWRHRTTGDHAVLERAHQTLSVVKRVLRHPSGLGYADAAPGGGRSLQNPHMHLLEAMLVLARSSGDPLFLEEARALVDLFRSHLFDPGTGTLAEAYDDEWTRFADINHRVVEPGHHYEWAWLLREYGKLTGDSLDAEGRALITFADQHGCRGAEGAVVSAVREDGRALDASARVWQQTEQLKARLALLEQEPEFPHESVTQTVERLLVFFLDRPTAGLWLDRIDAHGQPAADAVPASTLYHIVLAFAELIRVAEGR